MAALEAVPKLDSTMGAYYIGVLFGATLFGITSVQMFAYARARSWADPLWLRLLVLSLWCLECTHQIFVSHGVYRYLVSNPLNLLHLQTTIWTVIMEGLVTGMVASIVHVYYLTRIYSMSENFLLIGALAPLVLAELILSIIFCAKAVRVHLFSDLDQVKDWFIGFNAILVFASIAVLCAYVVLLHNQPTRTKSRYASMFHLIGIYALQAGLLPSLAALGSLVAFIARPDSLVYAPLFFCLGRLHIVSMLCVLNDSAPRAKRSTNASSNGVYGVDGLTPPRRDMVVRMSQFRPNRSHAGKDMSIHINTQQYVNRDDSEDIVEKAPPSAV